MVLPINIECLLGRVKVESNYVKFKNGRNSETIYLSISAFSNDLDSLVGGYILHKVSCKVTTSICET